MSAKLDKSEAYADSINESEKAFVKHWLAKINFAKRKYGPDFERMRTNMEFAAGIQWDGQEHIRHEKYINNVTLRSISQKVAQLYARDPQADITRIPRLDFEVWDETPESLEASLMEAVQAQSQGLPPSPETMALLNDYETGMNFRRVVDRVADTLKIVYDWQIAQQQPTFKAMMKSLVRRTTTCGVGYLRPSFVREGDVAVGSNLGIGSEADMMNRLHGMMEDETGEGGAEGMSDFDKAQQETKIALAKSLQKQQEEVEIGEDMLMSELVVWDEIDSLSVILDPACTSVKTFDKCSWLAIEYNLPIEDIENAFGVDLGGCSDVKTFNADGDENTNQPETPVEGEEAEGVRLGRVFEVVHKPTRSRFFLCEGYKGYLQAPEPVPIKLARFWPLLSLTFNDVIVVPGLKISCYPPSDVDLLFHSQQERNRQRDGLREHRKANIPGQVIPAGILQEDDKELIENRDPHDIIELKVPVNTDMTKLIQPFPQVEINPALYDTSSVDQDIQTATGMQEANFGPAKPNVTATVGAISEQSRQTGLSSNVDDVDDLLCDVAKVTVEISVRYMSEDNVKAIAGRGALFPTTDRDVFLNSISVNIAAASSGRPRQAIDVANFERLVPLMLQAGVNPKFVVREGVRRLGDRLNLADAFPLIPPSPTPLPAAKAQPQMGAGTTQQTAV